MEERDARPPQARPAETARGRSRPEPAGHPAPPHRPLVTGPGSAALWVATAELPGARSAASHSAASGLLSADLLSADFLVVVAAVTAASCLQASIGFGIGMVAAPVIALVDPALVPGTVIMLATAITSLVTVLDRTHLDLAGTGWALAGRMPGAALGALLVAALPYRVLALLIAGTVLTGVAVTAAGWRPRLRRRTLLSAGAVSGLMGTATSIGGPPMALVWQNSEVPRLRSNMSAYALAGSLISLGALWLNGQVDASTAGSFAVLLPAAVAGCLLSRLVNRRLDRERLRWTAIAVSVAGAVTLVAAQVL